MRADRARRDPRFAVALLACSVGGLALAGEEAPAPVTGSPALIRPASSWDEPGDSPTAASRPGAAEESGSWRPRGLRARWLRRIQATPADRAPAGRAAAPEG